MFGRFIFWTIVFVIVLGLCLHFSIEIPYFHKWIGSLPGDIILKKKDIMIYVPITSSAVLSLVWTIILTGLFGK